MRQYHRISIEITVAMYCIDGKNQRDASAGSQCFVLIGIGEGTPRVSCTELAFGNQADDGADVVFPDILRRCHSDIGLHHLPHLFLQCHRGKCPRYVCYRFDIDVPRLVGTGWFIRRSAAQHESAQA